MLPGSASRAHGEIGAAGGFVLLLPDPPVTHEAGGYDGFSTQLTGAGLAESAGAPSCSFWGSVVTPLCPHTSVCVGQRVLGFSDTRWAK